jgi:hypothetical protein
MPITHRRTWTCIAAALLGASSLFGATAQADPNAKTRFEWR